MSLVFLLKTCDSGIDVGNRHIFYKREMPPASVRWKKLLIFNNIFFIREMLISKQTRRI